MELKRYGSAAARWWWLLVLTPLLAGLGAFSVVRSQTPVYEAKATVLVNQAQTQVLTGPNYYDVMTNQQLSHTYGQLVTSVPVMDEAAANLRVSRDEVTQRVSGASRKDTTLIDITARHTDPGQAALFANEVARAFSNQIREALIGQQSVATTDLERQLTDVQASMQQRRQAIQRLSNPQPGLSEGERQARLAEEQALLESLLTSQSLLGNNLLQLRLEAVKVANSTSLVNPALPPVSPAGLPPVIFVVIGGFLGLVIASGFVIGREYLTDTVQNAADVEKASRAGLLGTIDAVESRRRRLFGQRRVVNLTPAALQASSGAVREAYDVIRTNLEFCLRGYSQRSMVITSASHGEGKTTTAANLAAAIAATGRKVILVDADLRKPGLQAIFNVPNALGLSSLFVSQDDLMIDEYLYPTGIQNLAVLPSGPRPPNPASLLSSERMTEIIAMLQARASVVIFDAPPMAGIADAPALAAQVDGVVVVVDASRTRGEGLADTVDRLEQVEATVWGVVLNKLHTRPGGGRGSYVYGSKAYARPRRSPAAAASEALWDRAPGPASLERHA